MLKEESEEKVVPLESAQLTFQEVIQEIQPSLQLSNLMGTFLADIQEPQKAERAATIAKLRNNSDYNQTIDQLLAEDNQILLTNLKNAPTYQPLRSSLRLHQPTDSDFRDILLELLYKVDSYSSLVKDQKKAIESTTDLYPDLKKDPELQETAQQLKDLFGEELLAQALISDIKYFPDTVIIVHKDQELELSLDKYENLVGQMSFEEGQKLKAKKIRAVTSSSFNESLTTFVPVPIILFAFIQSDIQNVAHLQNIPVDRRMYHMKIGTISHEIAHSLFAYLLNQNQLQELRTILEGYPPLTEYSEKYRSGVHANQLNIEEEFAEAVRLKVVAPEYLQAHYPLIAAYLTKIFPAIQSLPKDV